jgi:hypothetical protein
MMTGAEPGRVNPNASGSLPCVPGAHACPVAKGSQVPLTFDRDTSYYADEGVSVC